VAQDLASSAEWRQQAAVKIELGESLYREGRYYEAADAFGWVADVDLWYMHAGPRQIMALVRAGLADTRATEALAAATRAFRTLEGFPLPNDLQAEYQAIDRLLEDRANPPQDQPVPLPPSQTEPTPTPVPEPEQVTEPADSNRPDESDLSASEPAEGLPDPQPERSSLSPAAFDEPAPEPEQQPVQPAESVTEDLEQEQQEESPPPAMISADQSRPQVAQGDIISLAEVTTQPRLTESEPPVYPLKAQRRRVTGDVKLLVLVGVDGSVERLRFVSVPRENYGFEEAVEDVIDGWRFEPATKNGIVVRTWVPIRIPWS
jgi:TonB family protein